MTFADDLARLPIAVFSSPSIAFALTALIIFAVFTVYLLVFKQVPVPSSAPPYSHLSYPVVGALKLWSARRSFFRESAARSRSGHFSFHIGKSPVVGLMGEEGRKFFFESKQLDLLAGYGILFAQGPKMKNDSEDPHLGKSFENYFAKRLTSLMRTDKLAPRLKPLVSDIRTSLERLRVQARLGKDVINPHDMLYDMIFQLTIRVVGCNEIADDPEKLHELLKYYEMLDDSSTPMTVIFPWLPTPAMLKRFYAGVRLYMIFDRVVAERKRQGRTEDDGLGHLLERNDSVVNIVTFIASALYAGIVNSSVMAGSVLAFLASSAEWQTKVRNEIMGVVEAHASPDTDGQPIEQRLASVPFEALESSFPTVEMCSKESLRLNLVGCGFRRNITDRPAEIPGSKGQVIPAGQYAAYHFIDAHMNPDIYPDPQKFDPSRYLPGREEDKKQFYGWAGWGAARHPCLGMRFAKLELNLVIAYLVLMFDWELCNEHGGPEPRGLPKVSREGTYVGRPELVGDPKRPVYVRYRPRG